MGELLLDVPGMGELSMVGTMGSPSVFLDTDLRHKLRLRAFTVKEAHAAPPSPSPPPSKKNIRAQKSLPGGAEMGQLP